MRELAFASIEALSALLAKKKLSPVELTELYLSRIERINPKLNAFLTVAPESAMTEARAAERELARGKCRCNMARADFRLALLNLMGGAADHLPAPALP